MVINIPRPVKAVACFLIVSMALYFDWVVIKPWIAARFIKNSLTIDGLEGAMRLEPKNARYHYLTGEYLLSHPEKRNLKRAKESLIEAINLNPTKADHWKELWRVEEAMGNTSMAEKAIVRAVTLSPRNPDTRWAIVSHLLGKGEKKKSLKELRFIMENLPGERGKVFPLLSIAAGGDKELILKEAISDNTDTSREYLHYLIARKDTIWVKRLWKEMEERHSVSKEERIRLIDYMIEQGEIEEAKTEWKALTGTKKEPQNLIWDGGFEEEPTNGGFGWRIGKVDGMTIQWDSSASIEGKSYLMVEFDGKHNVDFSHISQIVPVEPRTRYLLRVSLKTEDITTTNGIKVEFYGNYGCNFYTSTETLTGTNPWREYNLSIETPSNCLTGTIRLKREKSNKFNNLIGGKAWIDEFRLMKVL